MATPQNGDDGREPFLPPRHQQGTVSGGGGGGMNMRAAPLLAVIVVAGVGLIAAMMLLGKHQPGSHAGGLRLGVPARPEAALLALKDSDRDLFGRRAHMMMDMSAVPPHDAATALVPTGQTLDVTIGPMEAVLAQAAANPGAADPVIFYKALYVDGGGVLVARSGSGLLSLQALFAKDGFHTDALKDLVAELKGRRIGVPPGGLAKAQVLAAVQQAGGDPAAYPVQEVAPADAAKGLESGALGVAVLTPAEATEATAHGAVVLAQGTDLGLGRIMGFLTTRSYLATKARTLEALTTGWFNAVALAKADPNKASGPVLGWLSKNAVEASGDDALAKALAANTLPAPSVEADGLFERKDGLFYWQRSWTALSNQLQAEGKAKAPIDTALYRSTN